MGRLRYLLARERQNLKALPPKKRWAYLWEYYKLTICVCAMVLVLLIVGIVSLAGRKKAGLYLVLINAAEGSAEQVEALLPEAGAVDIARYTLDAEAPDPTTVQVLAALFSMGDMDLYAADPTGFERYAVQGGFEDLSPFLTEEEQAKLSEHLHYSEVNGVRVLTGLALPAGSPLHRAGYYSGKVIVGIASQAGNFDNALAFLKALVQN